MHQLHDLAQQLGAIAADADLAAIFAPFFRSGTADALSGHGLALAIARRVVEMHGGLIDAANLAEGGLCVTLEFSSLRGGKITGFTVPSLFPGNSV